MARTGKPVDVLEAELLNGQKLQGPPVAREIYKILRDRGEVSEFPVFSAVHLMCYEGLPAPALLGYLQNLNRESCL